MVVYKFYCLGNNIPHGKDFACLVNVCKLEYLLLRFLKNFAAFLSFVKAFRFYV